MEPGWARCGTRNRKELRTMRFMMLVIPKGYEKAAADFAPRAELVARMTKYNDSLTKAGGREADVMALLPQLSVTPGIPIIAVGAVASYRLPAMIRVPGGTRN